MHLIGIRNKKKEYNPIIEYAFWYYCKRLGIEHCNWSVQIRLIGEKDCNSVVVCTDKIIIYINKEYNLSDILYTLAHEMIHVKQVVLNQQLLINEEYVIWKKNHIYYLKENGYGANLVLPSGKVVNVDYYKLPWEQEAYAKDKKLYLDFINQYKKLLQLVGEI